MTPAAARESYRKAIAAVGETVTIRRYSGLPPSRTAVNKTVRARVVGFAPDELIGGIVQGDRKLIVLAEDIGSPITLPIVPGANDKVVVRGREMTVKAVDDNTRRIAGELIALEITVGG